jgi:hypothetical protein
MNYPGEPSKDSSKIYEPAHPVGWIDNPDGTVTADVQAPLTEKERFIDVKDSNKYNITQDIAEVFEVYVKYVYEYNDATHPFKITGRKIVFYSDLVSASPFEINYGANLNSLKRTIDSSNIVTKMFVTPIASEYSDSGYISIAESDQNKMRDTFILNFDYFYEAGMLTDAQYQSIPIFEANLRKANISLEQILNKANDLSNEETTLTAKRATLLDRQTAAQDVINDCTDRLDLMNKGLTTNILTQDKEQYVVINDNNVLKILVKRKGVLNNAALVVTGATQAGIFTDEYGYVTEVCVSGAASGTYIYLTYQYDVLSYYRNVLQTYEGIHAAVTAQLASVNIQLGDEETTVANANGNLYERINANNAAFTTASDAKNKLVYDFNKMMGFYLREGKWQSNDYSISPFSKSSNVTAIYDATVFKGEQEPFYYKDVALTKQYYPYIDLYSLFSASFPTNFTPSKLVLKETWVDAAGKPMIKSYVMGAQCQMALIKVGTVIHPIVMILEDILSSNTHDFTLIYNSAVPITVTSIMKRSSSTAYQLIKKRVLVDDKNIVLSSFNVEKNPNTAGVIYNEYEDYNIARLDGKVYITFNINDKISWSVANFHISYQCNRSTEQFYLDALDVIPDVTGPDA